MCLCGAESSEVAPADISPGLRTGVSEGGVDDVVTDSILKVTPAGITGPGILLKTSSATSFLFQDWGNDSVESAVRTSGPLLCRRTSSGAADRCLCWCVCVAELALYKVSTPSGIITINDVPTKTPMPMVDIRRSRDCDRENERGRAPAKKDLEFARFSQYHQGVQRRVHSRNSHDNAQGEQREQTVHHCDSLTRRPIDGLGIVSKHFLTTTSLFQHQFPAAAIVEGGEGYSVVHDRLIDHPFGLIEIRGAKSSDRH